MNVTLVSKCYHIPAVNASSSLLLATQSAVQCLQTSNSGSFRSLKGMVLCKQRMKLGSERIMFPFKCSTSSCVLHLPAARAPPTTCSPVAPLKFQPKTQVSFTEKAPFKVGPNGVLSTPNSWSWTRENNKVLNCGFILLTDCRRSANAIWSPAPIPPRLFR